MRKKTPGWIQLCLRPHAMHLALSKCAVDQDGDRGVGAENHHHHRSEERVPSHHGGHKQTSAGTRSVQSRDGQHLPQAHVGVSHHQRERATTVRHNKPETKQYIYYPKSDANFCREGREGGRDSRKYHGHVFTRVAFVLTHRQA